MQYRRILTTTRCVACGCDDDHACEEGCWWIEVDRARGIGVCSSCEPEHDVRVFRVGERVWIAGAGGAEEVLAAYLVKSGMTVSDLAGTAAVAPVALTLTELWTTIVNDGHRDPETPRQTFASQLDMLAAADVPLPCLFAELRQ